MPVSRQRWELNFTLRRGFAKAQEAIRWESSGMIGPYGPVKFG